jgi:AraC-like DNA-binding protein
MKLKINSCGVCDCAPEWQWHTMGFSDYDLWAVFRGSGTIRPTSHGEISVHDGTCILLTPNTEYTARHDPEHPLLVITVHFDFLNENGEKTFDERLQARLTAYPQFFKDILLRVVSLYNSNDEASACVYLSAALEEFRHADPVESSAEIGVWQKIVNEICTEIDTSPHTPRLCDFAETYGYSERYVGKMFTQIKKISFSVYAQNSRINKAKTLLRLTDMPISDIAEELGFCDACHFTKNFGKIVGISPLSYRKQR